MMEHLIYYILSFTVEFLKLLLVGILFCKLQIVNKKGMLMGYVLILSILSFILLRYNIQNLEIVDGIVAAILLCIGASSPKKLGILSISYIGVCLVDMLFATLYFVIFNADVGETAENIWLSFALDSALVLVLTMILLIKKKIKIVSISHISFKHYMLLLITGIAFAYYLTAAWVLGLDKGNSMENRLTVLSLNLSGLIFMAICFAYIVNSQRKTHLKNENEVKSLLLKSQEEYYAMLLNKNEETRKFRHDISNHLYCMYTLFKQGEYEKLDDYFQDMNVSLNELKAEISTGNSIVDGIIYDLKGQYKEVKFKWKGKIPSELSLTNMDICTIFANLLKNAFESAIETEEKIVEVSAKMQGGNLFVSIINHTKQTPQIVNGVFISSKKTAGHGYGMKNVKECLKKNQGYLETKYEDGVFIVEVILLGVIEEE